VLESPHASYRFVNGLTGTIAVERVVAARLELVDVLGVQSAPGGFAPMRKECAERSGFAYTTMDELVKRYAGPTDGEQA